MKRKRTHAQPGPMIVAAWIGLSGCSERDAAGEPGEQTMHAPSDDGSAENVADATLTAAPHEDAGALLDATSGAKTEGSSACMGTRYDSTFAAIQKVIFEGRNCTNSKCHGEATAGGLDLRAEAAYTSLIEVESTIGTALRVMPGEPDESFLFQKLRAATEPGSVVVEGSPMPSGTAPLTPEHLEAVRRWIEAGAPRDGSIGDSITGQSDGIAELLGSCLPEVTPIEIKPLAPPSADEGIQITMAPFMLPGEQEVDVCFAQYYDFSEVVPEAFQDRAAGVFFVNGQRTRQDPHSHHLVIKHSGLGPEQLNDPSFGPWSCRGGEHETKACDPRERGACGSGTCASEPQHKAACIGYGPMLGSDADVRTNSIASAQTAQYYRAPRAGLYEALPIRGILYMNSHAFNLTSKQAKLHAWTNLLYAKERRHLVQTLAITDKIAIAHGQAPFTKQTHCATWTAPQNSALYTLSSHTHKRGSNFSVFRHDGTQIYQSANYSDPVEKIFEPPIHFDAALPEQRTLKYCADYNNGLTKAGKPDVRLVTRLSTMPDRTTCTPVACATGKVGSPCNGAEDDRACDSAPGASDGSCDACTITAGQTTENEMFVLSPSVVLHAAL